MEKKFTSGIKASNITGLGLSTLRRYGDSGKIEMIRTPGGDRRYNVDKFIRDTTTQADKPETPKINVCYCRVSSHSQAADLDRQAKYMTEKYPSFELITDIGSGINFERKGLQKIIEYAIGGTLNKLAISYKDRLCRIGYPLIEHILTKYSDTEIIIEMEHPETVNEEMANDLIQIMTVYTAKINGMRSYKRDKL